MTAGGEGLVALRGPDGATASVHPRGAHVVSWSTPDGSEQLYLSERAALNGAAAIRGGVPVIFPQFASEGPLPKHGFARTAQWRVVSRLQPDHLEEVTLELTDSAPLRDVWPHTFVAGLRVSLRPDELEIALSILNAGQQEFTFTAALHTYLRVADIAATELLGLGGMTFRDTTQGVQEIRQESPILRIEGEANRVYLGARHPVEVREPGRSRHVSMTGFEDVVVWNPGSAGEAALRDVEPGGSAHFVCVEAAVVAHPVTLAPAHRWSGTQTLRVITSP